MIDESHIIAALADPAQAARLLDALAQQTGDGRYRRAAGQLRCTSARVAGRPPCDDTAALASMRALIESGAASSAEFAGKIVARTIPHGRSVDSTARRIATKYRRNL